MNKKIKGMKNINIINIIVLIFGFGLLTSCNNGDAEFDDYDFSAVYFPYQYPIRTIVLGNDVYDNSNDVNHEFEISAVVEGIRSNTKGYTARFEYDEKLVSFDSMMISGTNKKIKILPTEYYQFMDPLDNIKFEKGKLNGRLKVKLTDAFFEDPLSLTGQYVIPLKIIGTSADSIICGEKGESVDNPDYNISTDWISTPLNFTLFSVKYINPYDAYYLKRGIEYIKDENGNSIDTIVYHNKYVVKDEPIKLSSYSKNAVLFSNILLKRNNVDSSGSVSLKLTFDDDEKCVITNTDDSSFKVSGSGSFSENTEEWGGKKRDAIYLNYTVTEGTNIVSIR